jgi:hypothetical protein
VSGAPREHYTETHGFTEQLFGLCYLLGFSFMPRLRDLADQQLYKLDKERSYSRLDPLLRGAVDIALRALDTGGRRLEWFFARVPLGPLDGRYGAPMTP